MRGELDTDSVTHAYTFVCKCIFFLFCKIGSALEKAEPISLDTCHLE